ncbi:helix-loop-helix DNA-binding domain-containing protein [Phascolomyces articulosus]|uniref:Helix-loop-helix DNA-binding domain-containing protein n=1 Tax=Phascolomyces articulosus TaxID=60185 RepID=A0AAD5K7L7_9FUNG|nr:helix-loop-helix DNA-binding domain-containing protein [Phascolomyces articulosus]
MSMYSPTQQEFDEQFSQTGLASMGTPHTTVGAVPVRNPRGGVFNPSASNSYQLHQRQGSFGAASIAISPPNNVAAAAAAAAAVGGRPIPFTDPNAQNWFGTSLDSNGSSFGQSPIFGGRDLIVSPSTSTGHLDAAASGYSTAGGPGTGEDEEAQQRNLQEMFEKRRRRRESHNAVERRRRDNINERIHELSTLLPDHLLENAPTTSNVMSVSSSNQGGAGASNIKAINKGTILKLSVDHIKELKDTLAQYKDRVDELERLIEVAKQDNPKIKTEDTAPRSRHERIGSLQFQQQFGKLHIEDSEQM